MRNLLIGSILFIAASCDDALVNTQNSGESHPQKHYFESQIATLLSEGYSIVRHTQSGEDLEQLRIDTMTQELWERELHGFLNMAPKPHLKDTSFQFSIDSAGIYEIERIVAKDTLRELQEVSTIKVKGTVELMTWKVRKRALLMDRDMEFTYQPLKGYRIKMFEDAAWSRPKTQEIFAEFTK